MPTAGYTVTPGPAQSDPVIQETIDWATREFNALYGQLTNFDTIQLNVLHAEPSKPREGMTVFADGTDWNPGSGPGLYTYTSGVWLHGEGSGTFGTFAWENYATPPVIGGTTPNIINATILNAAHGVVNIQPYGGQATLQLGTVSVATSPYIDFHASASNPDYDVRLLGMGSGSTAGSGGLRLDGKLGIGSTVNPTIQFEIRGDPTAAPFFTGLAPTHASIYVGNSAGTMPTVAQPVFGISKDEYLLERTEGAQDAGLWVNVRNFSDSVPWPVGYQANAAVLRGEQWGRGGDSVGGWLEAWQRGTGVRREMRTEDIWAGSSYQYQIVFVGTTDFTTVGAANNNIGTVFTATGTPTGTGRVYLVAQTAPNLVAGGCYQIETVGTTNFTLIGAPNNNVGTQFIATGPGTGTGTAFAIMGGTSWASFLNAQNVTGSVGGVVSCETNNANNSGFDHTWACITAPLTRFHTGLLSAAVDAVSNGTNRSAVGYNIRAGSSNFDIGVGASGNSIVTNFLRDDTSSYCSYKVTGNHVGGIDLTEAGFSSGVAIGLPAGAGISWPIGAAADVGIDFGLGTYVKRMTSDGRLKLSSQNNLIDVASNVAITPTSSSIPALAVNPIAASAHQGFKISQTGPTSGTTAGVAANASLGNAYLNYNLIDIDGESSDVTGVGVPYAVGLLVAMRTGGTNSAKGKGAGIFNLYHWGDSNPAAGRDHVALTGVGYSGASEGGTDTAGGAKGTMFGLSGGAILDSGSTNFFEVCGGEIDVAIRGTATARLALGLSVVNNGEKSAADLDAAYEIGGATWSWKTGLLLANIHGSAPILSTGTIIGTDGSANTVANFVDLSAYTFSSYILKFSNFQVNGSGEITTGVWKATTVAVAYGGTGDTGTAWTAYTPTVTAYTGSITSYTASGRYKTIGKTCFFEASVSVTDNGTGATALNVTLPFNAQGAFAAVHGRATSGPVVVGVTTASSNVASVITYAGNYPISGTSDSLTIAGCFETT